MKILLPVDGSDCTRRMLGYLAAHDELLQGDNHYTAFTVIDPASPYATHFSRAVSIEAFFEDQAEQVLGPVRAFLRQRGWKIETDHVPGLPVQAIVAKVETLQPDLIVMGTHGRSPIGDAVLGSVASGVLAKCRVPVLLIR